MKSDIGLHIQSFGWRRPFHIMWIIPIRGCHLPDLTGIVPLALSHLPSLVVPCVGWVIVANHESKHITKNCSFQMCSTWDAAFRASVGAIEIGQRLVKVILVQNETL
jgi:hypothetical protein